MLRVTTIFQGLQGAPYYSSMHFGGAGGGADAAAAHDAVADFWDAIKGALVTAMTWSVAGDVEVVNPATGQLTASVAVTQVNGQGTVTGEGLPFATQGLVRWRTGTYNSGREVRGRTFIPGMSLGTSAFGKLEPTTVALIGGAATTLAGFGGVGNSLVVWSRRLGITVDVNAATCWSDYAVMRSRRE